MMKKTMTMKTMFTMMIAMMMTMTLGARAGVAKATTSQDTVDDEQEVRSRNTSRRRRLQAHGSSLMQCFGPLTKDVCLAAGSCCTWNDSSFADIPNSMKCNVNFSCVDFGLDFNDDSTTTTTTNSTTNDDDSDHDGFLPSYDDYLFSRPTVNTYGSGDNTSWLILILIPLVLIGIVILLMKGKAIHLELTADDGDLCLGQDDIENSSPVADATRVFESAPASSIDVCSYPIADSAPIAFDAGGVAGE